MNNEQIRENEQQPKKFEFELSLQCTKCGVDFRKELELQTQALRGWLKVKEAAVYCDMPERTIRSWLKDGLRHSRLRSGTILIKVSWIDEFLERFEAQENQVDLIVDEVVRGL